MKPIVDINLDGKPYAQRNWEIIPRVGDTILLKNGEIQAKVNLVAWGDDSACHHEERQWIQLICESVNKSPN